MAGKNREDRIKIIDKLLRTGRKFTWEQISEECHTVAGIESVAKRTIEDDIRAMKTGKNAWNAIAPIKNEDGYHYTEDGYSIINSPIQDKETFALMNALDILNQFPEFEQSKKVKEVVDKLKSSLGIDKEQPADIIRFERVDYPAASQWISQLYPHIQERQPLTLTYQPYDQEPLNIKIVPLLLKEFNSRWFLIGYRLDLKKYHNYPLDRIQGFTEYFADISDIQIEFDPSTYFQEMVGVSPSEKGVKTVRFETFGSISNYVKTKKIHLSQKPINDEKTIFEINVHINKELIARLLSFGEGLKVISPPELVSELKDKITDMGKHY